MQTITASEFKAKCLKIMDEVLESGEPLAVTKHGKVVCEITPPSNKPKIDRSGMIGMFSQWESELDKWDPDERITPEIDVDHMAKRNGLSVDQEADRAS